MAQAAERLEQAATGAADEAAMLAAIAELEAASFEARLAIGLRLGETDEAPAPSRGRSRDALTLFNFGHRQFRLQGLALRGVSR